MQKPIDFRFEFTEISGESKMTKCKNFRVLARIVLIMRTKYKTSFFTRWNQKKLSNFDIEWTCFWFSSQNQNYPTQSSEILTLCHFGLARHFGVLVLKIRRFFLDLPVLSKFFNTKWVLKNVFSILFASLKLSELELWNFNTLPFWTRPRFL